MPSRIDKQFIDNLQNFTDSLDNLVQLLKEQNKKGGDAVNTMTSVIDGNKLKLITDDMKILVDTTKVIDNRTKEILSEVKAARKQKRVEYFKIYLIKKIKEK